jgi:hypothetical protein
VFAALEVGDTKGTDCSPLGGSLMSDVTDYIAHGAKKQEKPWQFLC